jgi:hypothetical protein
MSSCIFVLSIDVLLHCCFNDLMLSYLDRGVDSIPPGGMFNFLTKNTPRHSPAQPASCEHW